MVNTTKDMIKDLEELIERAYSASADAQGDVDEALRIGREEPADRYEVLRVQGRVVRAMLSGGSDAAASGLLGSPGILGPASTIEPRMQTPGRTSETRPWDRGRAVLGGARNQWLSRIPSVPHGKMIAAVLVLVLAPLAGYALGQESGSGNRGSGASRPVSLEAGPDRSPLGTVPFKVIPASHRVSGGTGSELPSDIIRTDKLTLRIKPHTTASGEAGRAERVVARAGGYVAAESRSGRGASVTMVVRVPESRFLTVVERLRRLGSVQSETMQSVDVSLDVVNLGARLTNLEYQRSVLLRLFNRATGVGATIHVEQVLSGVQSQIDQLQAQMRYLKNRVALATITMTLQTGAPSKHVVGPLVSALVNAGNAALRVVTGLILLLGYSAPVAALVLLGYVLFGWTRRRMRSRPEPDLRPEA